MADSPGRSLPSWWKPSASAPTLPLKSLSWPGITLGGFAQKQHGPSSAEWRRYPPLREPPLVIGRTQHHEPTRIYVARRTEESRTKREIIRCLKRFLARETWALMRPLREASNTLSGLLDEYRSINAACESFFATLEGELLDRNKFHSHSEAKMAVFTFIEGWYNPTRRHSALDYLSPMNYERRYLQEA